MVMSSPYYEQIRYIFLDRLNLAGNNNIDLRELYKIAKTPIVLLLKHRLVDFTEYLPKGCFVTVYSVRFFTVGIEKEAAKNIIRASWGDHKLPEALVVAGKIATAYNRLLKKQKVKC